MIIVYGLDSANSKRLEKEFPDVHFVADYKRVNYSSKISRVYLIANFISHMIIVKFRREYGRHNVRVIRGINNLRKELAKINCLSVKGAKRR
jgi:hypothetical protein